MIVRRDPADAEAENCFGEQTPMDSHDVNVEAAETAIQILLNALPLEQREHAILFCLDDLERLHLKAGCTPPAWINIVRSKNITVQSRSSSGSLRT